MKRACKNCPFRVNSPMGYDADALQALEDGYEPSCHATAGVDSIFAHDWPTDTICKGFVSWSNGEQGFQCPVACAADATQQGQTS